MNKRYIRWFLILTILFFAAPSPSGINAHDSEGTSFFRINDEYAIEYPIYTSSVKDFNLPLDRGARNYLVNIPISFKLDGEIAKDTLVWNFGDGVLANGKIIEHTYTHPGSYVITITSGEHLDTDPLQTVLVNILPNSNYRLPKAVIAINGQVNSNPGNSNFLVPGKKTLMLDGSHSQKGSAEIVEYLWDMGDTTSRNGSTINYQYNDPALHYIFPILRIKDANGFIDDTHAQIEQDNSLAKGPATLSRLGIITITLLSSLVLGFVFWIFRKRKMKKGVT